MSKKMNKFFCAVATLGLLYGTFDPSNARALSIDVPSESEEGIVKKMIETKDTGSETIQSSSPEVQQTRTIALKTAEQNEQENSESEQVTDQTVESTIPPSENAAIANDNSVDQAEIDKIGKGDKFNADLFLKFAERKLYEAYNSVENQAMKVIVLKIAVNNLISPNYVKERFDVAPETINHLVATYLLYDASFAKNSILFSLVNMNNSELPSTGFYPDTEQVEGTILNQQDGKMMTVKSYYVNQGSDKTVIIHGGVRGNWNNGIVSDEYNNFYNAGYNLLFVDSRASGASGGDYITYGVYESDDVLYWINRESEERPQQKILLYGGSMGAATMMSTLAKGISSNVKGIIENCGFKSVNEQLRVTYQSTIVPAINTLFSDLDLAADQAHEDMYMSMLQKYYIDPYVKIDLSQDLPLIGMTNSMIPKLIIHGSADTVVPVLNAHALYDVASGYKNLLIVEGADHGKAQEVDPVAYNQHISDFLKVVFEDKVQVRYQDNEGKSLLADDYLILTGAYGDPYKTEEKIFDGYELISKEGPVEGTFNETIPTVVYTYQKKVSNPGNGNENTENTENKENPSVSEPPSKNEPVKNNPSNPTNTITVVNTVSSKESENLKHNGGKYNKMPTTNDTNHHSLMVLGSGISASVLLFWFYKVRKGTK